MLNTKDIAGYLRPLAKQAMTLHGVSIPGETATLSAAETVAAARQAGFQAEEAADVLSAVCGMLGSADPHARILICGSLYLTRRVLRENG